MALTKYVWDPLSDSVRKETDESNLTTVVYSNEPEKFGSVISQHRSGQSSNYHYDATGSTRALTDENGDVSDRYTYTAFGEEVDTSGTTENQFRYIGQKGYYFDSETNDYYVRARTYQPKIARWSSRDPFSMSVLRFRLLQLGLGRELFKAYEYSANNSVNFNDPSGLKVKVDKADCCECDKIKAKAHEDFKKKHGQHYTSPTGRTCKLSIRCEKGKKRGCLPRSTRSDGPDIRKCAHTESPRTGNTTIKICLSCRCKGLNVIMAHEMKHFYDFCDGKTNNNCTQCKTFEKRGAKAGCEEAGKTEPALTRCIRCTVNMSCKGFPATAGGGASCKPFPLVDMTMACTCDDIGLPADCGI